MQQTEEELRIIGNVVPMVYQVGWLGRVGTFIYYYVCAYVCVYIWF